MVVAMGSEGQPANRIAVGTRAGVTKATTTIIARTTNTTTIAHMATATVITVTTATAATTRATATRRTALTAAAEKEAAAEVTTMTTERLDPRLMPQATGTTARWTLWCTMPTA